MKQQQKLNKTTTIKNNIHLVTNEQTNTDNNKTTMKTKTND